MNEVEPVVARVVRKRRTIAEARESRLKDFQLQRKIKRLPKFIQTPSPDEQAHLSIEHWYSSYTSQDRRCWKCKQRSSKGRRVHADLRNKYWGRLICNGCDPIMVGETRAYKPTPRR